MAHAIYILTTCVDIFRCRWRWCLSILCWGIDRLNVVYRRCCKETKYFRKKLSVASNTQWRRKQQSIGVFFLPQVIFELHNYVFAHQWLEERVEQLKVQQTAINLIVKCENSALLDILTILIHFLQFPRCVRRFRIAALMLRCQKNVEWKSRRWQFIRNNKRSEVGPPILVVNSNRSCEPTNVPGSLHAFRIIIFCIDELICDDQQMQSDFIASIKGADYHCHEKKFLNAELHLFHEIHFYYFHFIHVLHIPFVFLMILINLCVANLNGFAMRDCWNIGIHNSLKNINLYNRV